MSNHSYTLRPFDGHTLSALSPAGARQFRVRLHRGRLIANLDISIADTFVDHRVAWGDVNFSLTHQASELRQELVQNWAESFDAGSFSDEMACRLSQFFVEFGFREGIAQDFDLHGTRILGHADALTVFNGFIVLRLAIDEVDRFTTHIGTLTDCISLRDPGDICEFADTLRTRDFITTLPPPVLWLGDQPHPLVVSLKRLAGCRKLRRKRIEALLRSPGSRFWAGCE